ncbi:MAG: hypothetical protein ABIS00_14565 [Gemmatimonadales bacterium]
MAMHLLPALFGAFAVSHAAAQQGKSPEPQLVVTEQFRLTGATEATPFGRIDCIAAMPDGGVALFDGKGIDGPTLLILDAQGKLRRHLGRRGAGPGEYSSSQLLDCITVTPEGTIALFDRGLSRITRWARDGKLLPTVSVPVQASGFPPYLVAVRDGSFYVHSLVSRPAPGLVFDGAAYGYIHLDATGTILDTLRPAALAQRKQGHLIGDPFVYWFPRPDGSVVEADEATLGYRIRDVRGIWHPVSHPFTVLPFSSAERAEEAASQEWTALMTRGAVPARELATNKPAFGRIMSDPESRVWLLRRVPSVPGTPRPDQGPVSIGTTQRPVRRMSEPPVFVRFSATGKYEGEVRIPLESAWGNFFVAIGNTVWSTGASSDGEPQVIKWRVEMP